MFKKLQPYNKFLVALLGAAVTVVVQFYGNNDLVQVGVALLAALGVYQVKNGVKD